MDTDMAPKPHDDMVRNILDIWTRATDEQIAAGSDWYAEAHAIAGRMRTESGYRLSAEQCAGIISALSPMTPWNRNVTLAQRAVACHVIGQPLTGTLSSSIDKVDAILSGDSPWHVLTSQKVRAFFECILYNGDTDTVCVDRHAMSVAYGCTVGKAEQGMTARQYGAYAAAYVDAAAQVGVPAGRLQAITWVVWRDMRGIG